MLHTSEVLLRGSRGIDEGLGSIVRALPIGLEAHQHQPGLHLGVVQLGGNARVCSTTGMWDVQTAHCPESVGYGDYVTSNKQTVKTGTGHFWHNRHTFQTWSVYSAAGLCVTSKKCHHYVANAVEAMKTAPVSRHNQLVHVCNDSVTWSAQATTTDQQQMSHALYACLQVVQRPTCNSRPGCQQRDIAALQFGDQMLVGHQTQKLCCPIREEVVLKICTPTKQLPLHAQSKFGRFTCSCNDITA